MRNRLNELSPQEWLRFQKSWFVHNPPPRERGVLVHPAKFPESLCEEFIAFFTKPGELVLDPMCGTGSALLAAVRQGRRALGVELSEKYAGIAGERLQVRKQHLPPGAYVLDLVAEYAGKIVRGLQSFLLKKSTAA